MKTRVSLQYFVADCSLILKHHLQFTTIKNVFQWSLMFFNDFFKLVLVCKDIEPVCMEGTGQDASLQVLE